MLCFGFIAPISAVEHQFVSQVLKPDFSSVFLECERSCSLHLASLPFTVKRISAVPVMTRLGWLFSYLCFIFLIQTPCTSESVVKSYEGLRFLVCLIPISGSGSVGRLFKLTSLYIKMFKLLFYGLEISTQAIPLSTLSA